MPTTPTTSATDRADVRRCRSAAARLLAVGAAVCAALVGGAAPAAAAGLPPVDTSVSASPTPDLLPSAERARTLLVQEMRRTPGVYTQLEVELARQTQDWWRPLCDNPAWQDGRFAAECADWQREAVECASEFGPSRFGPVHNLTTVRFLTEQGEVFRFRLPTQDADGCITSELVGGLSWWAEWTQCELREGEFGGYPYAFYGRYPAADRYDCVDVLGPLGRAEIPVPDGAIPRPVLESGELETP